MLLLGGFSILAITGPSEARFENPGFLMSQLVQTISAFLAGGYIEGRSDSNREGCMFGGADYAEGAWVPLDTIRQCQCTGGSISEYCKFPSFPVHTKMNFQVEQKGLGRVQATEKQKKIPSIQVKMEGYGVRVMDRQKQSSFKIKEESQIVKTNPRRTSGRGTAKLFRLFTEERKPVIWTSNKTGCHIRGHFYNFPLDSISAKATCKCTDAGMLWCWEAGLPSCTGCFVGGAFFGVGDDFKLTDGNDCTCHCERQASNDVCMAGTLDQSKRHV